MGSSIAWEVPVGHVLLGVGKFCYNVQNSDMNERNMLCAYSAS